METSKIQKFNKNLIQEKCSAQYLHCIYYGTKKKNDGFTNRDFQKIFFFTFSSIQFSDTFSPIEIFKKFFFFHFQVFNFQILF